LPFPIRVRARLVEEGRAVAHHVLPQSGWVSYPIRADADVENAIALFRLNYERPWRGELHATPETAEAVS
jgi:hypothetical protein